MYVSIKHDEYSHYLHNFSAFRQDQVHDVNYVENRDDPMVIIVYSYL